MADTDTGMLAELINAKSQGTDAATMAALFSRNNNSDQWNNPFMYLIWLALLGGNGNGLFGGGSRNTETDARFNQLSQQISDNQNTNSLQSAVSSNHDFLHGFQNSMNMGFAGTAQTINNASMSNIIGQKDAAAQMASCCCDIKSNILNQTNQLQGRIDQLANGVAQGFAQVGFLTQQQTNELNTNANANTQRIVDLINSQTTQELRDKLYEMSQSAQTASIVNQLKSTTTTTA